MSLNSMTYSTSNTFFFVNNISVLVNRSNFTLVSFKAAFHANHVVERTCAESSSYISRHVF